MHDQNVQTGGHTWTVQRRCPVLPATRAPRHPQHGVLGAAATSRAKSIRLHQQIELQSLNLLCLRQNLFSFVFFFLLLFNNIRGVLNTPEMCQRMYGHIRYSAYFMSC